MGENLSGTAQCFRVLFVISNIIFMLIGLAILGVGIYLQVVGNNFAFLTGNTFVTGAALLIICGGVTVVVTGLGVLGGIGLWRPLLVIYIICLVILVLVEIVAGILGFVYRGVVVDQIANTFDTAIRGYVAGPDSPNSMQSINDAVNFVQNTFSCCGSTGPQSWIDLNPGAIDESGFRPPACARCNATTDTNCQSYSYNSSVTGMTMSFNAVNEGCLGATSNALQIAAYTVGGVGIAIGIFEIIGILISIGLIYRVYKKNELEDV